MTLQNAYRPIDCSYYDYLEFFATTKKQIPVKFKTPKNQTVTLQTQILNLITQNGEEFMQLASGDYVRLDHIIEIDGIKLHGFCAI